MKNIVVLGLVCAFLMSCRENENKTNIVSQTTILDKVDLENWMETPHVSGRLATEMDVNAGSATFIIDSQGKDHKPLDIQLPSLAFQVDVETNKKTPVIVIQAEMIGEQHIVGVKYLDGSYGVCEMSELEFVESPSEFKK
ncbi:hypothetical protein J0X14_00040 [Muricauda sp. CAU 1633]|uniref:hypothetical protein n=1 Tax=Allomuricauda sp. CAU 1633 TaxID=2816036 RepID=UPI001A8E436F|nr:hypothetical protein [Muricauda sp. CAU 1633]MBO0320667.1 hypothetical protein [Muricauda sp. CAU 1633]